MNEHPQGFSCTIKQPTSAALYPLHNWSVKKLNEAFKEQKKKKKTNVLDL